MATRQDIIAALASRIAPRRSLQRRGSRRWLIAALSIAVLVTVPLLVVLGAVLSPAPDVWAHLSRYVLPEVLTNTLWLALGVAGGTAVLGIGLAWLTAVCEFPGRRFFSWALLLPIAVPGYVLAFVVVGLFEYAGPVQTALRAWLGAEAGLPPIRNRAGVVLVLTLTLYPYVYLIVRNAFLSQGKRSLEVAQSLGLGVWAGFFRVALPMARPWIAGGVLLVLMETLADFGTVSVFNYDTFTTAIYKAWFNLFSVDAALQLAAVLILIVFVVVAIEQRLRSRAGFTAAARHDARVAPIRLRRGKAWSASGCCALALLLGFVLPFTQLAIWAWGRLATDLNLRYVEFAGRTLLLAAGGALIITATALALAYAVRNYGGLPARLIARWATLGYALPGAVLAVGVFVPVAALNNGLQGMLNGLVGDAAPQLLLQSSLLTLLIAYLIRFLAVAYNPTESGLLRITHSLDEASRVLGVSGRKMLGKVHLPMLKGALLTAMTLTFVDLMKEMPITLMTRPFGWETLAVRVFEMTSEGEWERAALPAVAIVIVGLIPVIMLTRGSDRVD